MEYIIKADDGEEFDIPYSKWKDVLVPKTIPFEVVAEGLRLKIRDCEISFAPEAPGTHIVFECENFSQELADQIVREIVENAESFTGQTGLIVPLQ